MIEVVRDFSGLTKLDAALAGGKGASLGEMTRAGIPVPPGFVVLTTAFEEFLHHTGLKENIAAVLDRVNHDDVASVDRASEEIRGMIMAEDMPRDVAAAIRKSFATLKSRYVAVRSSATAEDSSAAAWAGQLESYLNTTAATLLDNVKKCWASLFTPRAIFYRFEKKLHGQNISVAVVVQKMVASESAGIAFSVHPVTQDKNQMIIEAGFGLGEAIVSGQITPDSYVLEKRPQGIIETHVAEKKRALVRKKSGGNEWIDIPAAKSKKQILSDDEILRLGKVILTSEQRYGFPVDIEWAKERGKFFIVQSRPITTLGQSNAQIRPTEKQTLTNIFSREKSLIYFCVWNDSDRKGIEFAGEKVQNNLFIVPPTGKKGSVWYEQGELESLKECVVQSLTSTKNPIWEKLKKLSVRSWALLEPYAKQRKNIRSAEEFATYYRHLVNFWVCLNSFIYEILEDKRLDPAIRKYLIAFRDKTEKYTEALSLVLTNYLEKNPKIKHLAFVITFDEAVAILRGRMRPKRLKSLGQRLAGCFMFNQKVYPLKQLSRILKERGLEFETADQQTSEIKGTSAYRGVAQGPVKIIHGFADLQKIQPGDILVTQMTNPKYLPAIQKSVAMVTDEGGTLCHAAISARELKKPCIIGTKIATQVLRDGDVVEVDADRGVVRRISDSGLILTPAQKSTDTRLAAEEIGLDLNLREWELEFQQRNAHPPIMADLWLRALRDGLASEMKLSFSPPDYIFTGQNKGYVRSGDKRRILSALLRAVRRRQYLRFVFHRTMAVMNMMNLTADRILKRLSSHTSAAQLLSEWGVFEKAILSVIPWFYIPWYLSEENVLIDRVKSRLKKCRDSVERITDFKNAVGILTFPVKDAEFQKERRAFFTLVKLTRSLPKFQDHPRFKNQASVYLRKYAWMKTFIVLPIEPLTYAELVAKVGEAMKTNLLDGYTVEQAGKKKNERLRRRLLTLIAKDAELRRSITDAQELGLLLTASVEQGLKATAKLLPFYKQIARRLGLRYAQWVYLTSEEIQDGLRGKINASQLDLRSRRISYAATMRDGDIAWIFGEKAKSLSAQIDSSVGHIEQGLKEFSGQSAFPGRVTGSVRIALLPQASKKVRPGEILVTSMTSPDYIQAMKKAAAIVTNEGGLLSHAAIVSRELGKPCIVGTKVATKVLKDGDLVEVDADRGVIRKIDPGPKREAAKHQKFVKTYTRNFSIIMQEAWFAANKQGVIERLDLREYPYDPPYVYFMRDGAEEVWENTAATKWLVDQLVEKIQRDPSFFPAVYRRYLKQLAEVERWWGKNIGTLAELRTFVKKVYEGVSDFVIIYAALFEPRIPAKFRVMAKNMRQTDVYFAECNATIMRALRRLYPKLGYLVCYITQAELGGKVSTKELRKRDGGFAFIPGVIRQAMSFDDFVGRFPQFEFQVERAAPETTELKGRTAYTGNVTGRVRIVKRIEQVTQVQRGEVIVSPMTTPDFLPAMKKAAAFVTDEGGITCHAAIVARELKKPCVIGTKFATQVFKDGDLVEVDASRGEVRKLSSPPAQIGIDGYRAFSDPANVDVMIRHLSVWPEQVTLEVTLLDWPDGVYKNLPNWVKYVSTESKNKHEVYLYWDTRYELAFLKPIEQRLLSEPRHFDWMVRRFHAWYKLFEGHTSNISRRGRAYYERRTNAQLRRDFRDLINTSRFSLGGYYVVYDLMNLLTRLVHREIDQLFPSKSVEEIDQLYRDVSLVGITSVVQTERMTFLRRLRQYQRAKTPAARQRIIRDQWYDFTWMVFNHTDNNEMTIEDYRRKFDQNLNLDATKELAAILKEQRVESARARTLLRQFKESPTVLRHIKWLRMMMEYRNHQSLYLHAHYAHAEPLLNAIAARLKIKNVDIWWLSRQEIDRGLQGRIDTRPSAKARAKHGFTIKQVGNEIRVFTGVKPEDVHELSAMKGKELRGTAAYPGNVSGIARVISDPWRDGKTLRAGDILVTSMTTPEFVPLLKRAAAVVTDEGGLLCHAAIVARELKKPCVIGTKVATQMLQSGQRVEVNADDGVVTVLHKKKPASRGNRLPV